MDSRFRGNDVREWGRIRSRWDRLVLETALVVVLGEGHTPQGKGIVGKEKMDSRFRGNDETNFRSMSEKAVCTLAWVSARSRTSFCWHSHRSLLAFA